VSAETMATVEHHDETADHTHEAHPNRDRTYVKVALVLAVLTGIETFTYFESAYPASLERLVMPLLIVLMGSKFYLIAAYFMHLKWDRPVLRRVFLTGIVIAVSVYVITLTAFKFWNPTDYMPN
jgi:cytochrome c oxidase subunit IV